MKISNVYKYSLVYSCVISHVLCCCRSCKPTLENTKKYIAYVLGIKEEDILFSFKYKINYDSTFTSTKLANENSISMKDNFIPIATDFNNKFKELKDIVGCHICVLGTSAFEGKHISLSLEVFIIKQKVNIKKSSKLLKKYEGGDMLDFYKDTKCPKIILGDIKKPEKGDNDSAKANIAKYYMAATISKFSNSVNVCNLAIDDTTLKTEVIYTSIQEVFNKKKSDIYLCM